MPETESLEYLQAELSQQISGFNSSRRFFRSAYFYFTLSTVGLSAVTTVLIGASHMVPDSLWWLPLSALVCSAITTVLAAYEGFLSSKDLWVQKTDAWMAFQRLADQIDYAKAKSGGTLTQEAVDELYVRYEQLVTEELETWKKIRGGSADSMRRKVGQSSSGTGRG